MTSPGRPDHEARTPPRTPRKGLGDFFVKLEEFAITADTTTRYTFGRLTGLAEEQRKHLQSQLYRLLSRRSALAKTVIAALTLSVAGFFLGRWIESSRENSRSTNDLAPTPTQSTDAVIPIDAIDLGANINAYIGKEVLIGGFSCIGIRPTGSSDLASGNVDVSTDKQNPDSNFASFTSYFGAIIPLDQNDQPLPIAEAIPLVVDMRSLGGEDFKRVTQYEQTPTTLVVAAPFLGRIVYARVNDVNGNINTTHNWVPVIELIRIVPS